LRTECEKKKLLSFFFNKDDLKVGTPAKSKEAWKRLSRLQFLISFLLFLYICSSPPRKYSFCSSSPPPLFLFLSIYIFVFFATMSHVEIQSPVAKIKRSLLGKTNNILGGQSSGAATVGFGFIAEQQRNSRNSSSCCRSTQFLPPSQPSRMQETF